MTGTGSLADIGFIGAGTLTAAVVRGLRAKGEARAIRLSPRSEAVSRSLAAEFPNVTREGSNADVVARSGTVVLAVRPQDLDAALDGLEFRPDHLVISFVATVGRADVARLVSPARRVCRVTPLPSVALCKGPIVVLPPLPEALALFEGLGDLVLAEDEAEAMALGCPGGLLSTFFEVERTVASWLEIRGVPPERASLYTRSLFAGLAETGLARLGSGLAGLADEHQTRGGLNEHGRATLRDLGFFDALSRALDGIASRSLRPTAGGEVGGREENSPGKETEP